MMAVFASMTLTSNGDGSLVIASNITLVNILADCEDGIYVKREADSEEKRYRSGLLLTTQTWRSMKLKRCLIRRRLSTR